MQLQNGKVTYWHIEQDRHDVIFGEGPPVENHLDIGDHSDFVNGGAPRQLYPDFAFRRWAAAGCASLRVTSPQLEATPLLVSSKAAAHEDLLAAGNGQG